MNTRTERIMKALEAVSYTHLDVYKRQMYGCKYLNFSRSRSEMELIARQMIQKREGDNCPQEVLDEYADPCTCKYEQMIEDIRKQQNFTTLRYHRLDDLLASIGIEPCKVCTYCFNGKE